MQTIHLMIPSGIIHNSQIITGFLRLRDQGTPVEVTDRSGDSGNPFYDLPVVQAEYRGKKLLYDLWDGYQDPENMGKGLAWCDYYFKRSFSLEKNRAMFPEAEGKMYPLGFNYPVTHKENPINEPGWKALLKPLLGKAPDRYFVTEVFEGKPRPLGDQMPKVLFLTQLWDDQDPKLSPELNRERTEINRMRISIIRALREEYGERFLGGLNDTPLSRAQAPELIMPAKYTRRQRYLRLLHSSDICIATMGLHESIGWKMGEYVAAAKAVVQERPHYTVPGDYREGAHYLSFTDDASCIRAVRRLMEDPQAMRQMQQANYAYYQAYLKPEMLVKNTLELVDRDLDNGAG